MKSRFMVFTSYKVHMNCSPPAKRCQKRRFWHSWAGLTCLLTLSCLLTW